MKFKIHVDGTEHQIEAGADGTVSLGGETFQAKVSGSSEDRRMVRVGDKSYEVRIVENCADTGIIVLEVAGERIPVTVADVTKSAAKAASARGPAAGEPGAGDAAKVPEEVREGVWAPVPGKIVNVMVKPGDKVEEGTPVVILEAMKMENELHAPKNGTVTAVLVKKGDQADKGQLLVAFE